MVERAQRTVREMIRGHRMKSGTGFWSDHLSTMLHTYNQSRHSVTGLSPFQALQGYMQGDEDSIAYVREKNLKAARKSLSKEGSILDIGSKVRVSLYAVSSAARAERSKSVKGFKMSMQTSYSKAIFTIRTRSQGTLQSHREYQLVEMPSKRFYRNDLLPVPDMAKLRQDTGKVPPRDRMDRLEKDFIADLEEEQQQDAQETKPVDASTTAKNDPSARFIGAKVQKEFVDAGWVTGVVIRHVPPSSEAGQPEPLRYDNDDSTNDPIDGGMFNERFVIEYSNGKKEAVRPEELLDMLTSEGTSNDAEEDPTTVNDTQGDMPIQQQSNTMIESKANKKNTKKKKQKKPDAYLNRRIRWTEGGKAVYGTVMSIAQLKGKGGKLYLVKWDESSGWGENRLTVKQVRDNVV
jgi:hypothetical protein